MIDSLKNALCGFIEMMLNEFMSLAVLVILTTAFVFALIFGGAIGVTAYVGPRACAAGWADFEHRYTLHGGCQIRIDGRWVPTRNVKVAPATQASAA